MKRTLLLIVSLLVSLLSHAQSTSELFKSYDTYILSSINGTRIEDRMDDIKVSKNGAFLTISFKAVYLPSGDVPPYYYTLTIDLRSATIVNGYWSQSYDEYGLSSYRQTGNASMIEIKGGLQYRLVIPQYKEDKTSTFEKITITCSSPDEGNRVTSQILALQKDYKEPEPQYKEDPYNTQTTAPATSLSSSELFTKLKGYYEEYEVSSRNGYSSKAETVNRKVSFKYPYLIFSFQDRYINGTLYSLNVNENELGNVTLKVPITSTTVINNGTIVVLESSEGLEHSVNNKKNLISKYGFYTTSILANNLSNTLKQFIQAVKSEGFTGSYGVSSRTSSGTGSRVTGTVQSQSTYTYYNNAGFAIKKTYKLQKNTSYISAVQKLGTGVKIIDAYSCAQNSESGDPNKINIININVIDENNSAESLKTYKQNLTRQGFNYRARTWNGLTGVEYSFKQDMGTVMVPTKTFWGYKGNRFFLIQLGSLTNCELKFEELLNSIKVL